MVSAFELYLVFLMDSVWIASTLLAILSFLIAVVFCCTGGDDVRFPLCCLVSFLFFCFVAVFTPTTKQMAAIMVIPKIATIENVEALTSEAKSLYELAKEYFRESVTDKEAK